MACSSLSLQAHVDCVSRFVPEVLTSSHPHVIRILMHVRIHMPIDCACCHRSWSLVTAMFGALLIGVEYNVFTSFYDELGETYAEAESKTDSIFGKYVSRESATVVLLFLNALAFVSTLLLMLIQLAIDERQRTRRQLRWRATGEAVCAPALSPQLRYHGFLSHEWGSGQEKVRVIKTRLLEMVTGFRIFLGTQDFLASCLSIF